ncbi:MAG: FAD-dependent thymidylate synthase [Calditrichaeota bacterium]|nr:FAD-dependent thymidylate synthase [Calditrichota bacterium]
MEDFEYHVLDKGIVRLVDFMGGDNAVVQAARVSFGQGTKGEEKDRKLIDYLIRNAHETPFEQAIFKFHIKCPIFVARQWFRHRWASYNEISGRYTEMSHEFYVPEKFRTQEKKNYTYSDLKEPLSQNLREKIETFYEQTYRLYEELLADGVAKEQARIVLPLSLYTQFYWAVNARSLMNFVKLRTDEHAQYEIRVYANAIADVFQKKMPWTFESFKKHVLEHDEKSY